MKNKLEGVNSRLDDTDEQISNLEDTIVETTQSEQWKKNFLNEAVSGTYGKTSNILTFLL